jgi:hypothetical protein
VKKGVWVVVVVVKKVFLSALVDLVIEHDAESSSSRTWRAEQTLERMKGVL